MYKPRPIDTKKIELDDEILKLSELLAENTHAVWAETRLKQGWKYGKVRNDEKKEHPCLVEYDQLSEEEKEFDRNTALETLKLIVKLNYKIIKNTEE